MNGHIDSAIASIEYYDGHRPNSDTFHYVATWAEERSALRWMADTYRCQYIIGEGKTVYNESTVAMCGAHAERTHLNRDHDGRFSNVARYCELHFGRLFESGDVTGWMASGLWRMAESRQWYAIL